VSSIHKRRDTGKFVVRWREGGRAGAQRARTFDLERDAKAWRAHVERLEQLGQLAHLDAGKVTLGEFVEEWWISHAVPNLAPSTREVYKRVWAKHAHPRLAARRLRDLTPQVLDDFRIQLVRKQVGDPTIIKTLTMLQAVFSAAVVRGAMPANPLVEIRKPRQRRTRDPRAFAPTEIEALRALLRPRDATLVSVLAYAGPRPAEALSLEWRHVGRRVVRFYAPKTRSERTVPLLGPLAQDLAAWKLACGRPADRTLVFPRADGGEWSESDRRNWRRRIFQPACERAGLGAHVRPYDLRHSFVSLLIHEGRSVVDVARQAGHSPQTCLSTYAHVLDEFDPSERVPAEQAIRAAREARVPDVFPKASG
jgi:integrase